MSALRFVGLTLLLSLFSGQGYATGTTAKWTIMVYMNAKNNLEPDSFANFEQMARVADSSDVNILLEYGRPLKHWSGREHEVWSGVRIYKIHQGIAPTTHDALQEVVTKDHKTVDM